MRLIDKNKNFFAAFDDRPVTNNGRPVPNNDRPVPTTEPLSSDLSTNSIGIQVDMKDDFNVVLEVSSFLFFSLINK